MNNGFRWFYPLFFLSGFPALIYQIVWQRTLFAIYGVNIESVTIVVCAFMLGLGIGSLAGGRVSKSPTTPLLLLFGCIELGIAAYGVVSLRLFHAVAQFSAAAPPAETAVLSFGLVLIPTLLMGATLPLLTAQLVRISGNVGRSVGVLYFVNTLGSAVACFVAAWLTMPYLGMSKSVTLAAVVNLAVGVSVLLLHFRWRGRAAVEFQPEEARYTEKLPYGLALMLAGLAGFISLCYEIVWYRLYSFASGGPAQCFAYVLGAFLTGIAFGSLVSRRLCVRATAGAAVLTRSIAILMIVATAWGFAHVPLMAMAVQKISFLWILPVVTLTAGLLGATFPLICHVSVNPDSRAGAGLSYLYLSNIIGSVAGAWLVGFILMDIWSLRTISVFLVAMGVLVAVTLIAMSLRPRHRWIAACAAVLIIIGAEASSHPLFADVYGQMQSQAEWGRPGTKLKDVVETRSGVVTVDQDAAIFGGGVFDGWVVTDIHKTDTVIEPLSLSLIHPNPEEVLEVGMSGGAWSEIIANNERVKKQTIIEINPGYVQVAQRYPAVSPFLKNPKVEVVIDDGRRWMQRHHDRKFDVIVMDTIYHWRSHATNLLSVEFLEMARSMLKPGGVIYYNATYSEEAQRTGAILFPYAYRFGLFMAVSDSPIQVDKEHWRSVLLNYTLEGKRIFDPDSAADQKILAKVLKIVDTLPGDRYDYGGMETRDNILRRTAGKRIVRDDNMATEWGDYDWRN